MMSLTELAIVWGTSKQRFVTERNLIVGFPDPEKGKGNEYEYAAKKALTAMLKHEMRHDAAAVARANLTSEILGQTRDDPAAGHHSVSDLAKLSRLAAELQEREVEQGLLIPFGDVAAVAGDIFSEISDFGARLTNEIDPHGKLPAATRRNINDAAAKSVAHVHNRLKRFLVDAPDPDENRPASPRPRKARTPR